MIIAKNGSFRGFMGKELPETVYLWIKREEIEENRREGGME